jgi:hypothetical protein
MRCLLVRRAPPLRSAKRIHPLSDSFLAVVNPSLPNGNISIHSSSISRYVFGRVGSNCLVVHLFIAFLAVFGRLAFGTSLKPSAVLQLVMFYIKFGFFLCINPPPPLGAQVHSDWNLLHHPYPRHPPPSSAHPHPHTSA